MDRKKLFHVLVVGGAVIGTGGGCEKPKPGAQSTETPPGQAAPAPTAPAAKSDSDTNGTPPAAEGQPQEKGGGAAGW